MLESPSFRLRTISRSSSASVIAGQRVQKLQRTSIHSLHKQIDQRAIGIRVTREFPVNISSPVFDRKPSNTHLGIQRSPVLSAFGSSASSVKVRRHPIKRIIITAQPNSRSGPQNIDTFSNDSEDTRRREEDKCSSQLEETETQKKDSKEDVKISDSTIEIHSILNSDSAIGQVFDTASFKKFYLKARNPKDLLVSCLKKKKEGVYAGSAPRCGSESPLQFSSTSCVSDCERTPSHFSAGLDRVAKSQAGLIQSAMITSTIPFQTASGRQAPNRAVCTPASPNSANGSLQTKKKVTFSENVIFFVYEHSDCE